MAEAKTAITSKPVWIDLMTSDPEASRKFYATVFDWDIDVNPDPKYGGYAMAKVGEHQVAGIAPKPMPEAPTAWSIYIGTPDAKDLAKKVSAAGGQVISEPMDIPGQGTMAVFQDPTGAFISAWQSTSMGGFHEGEPNTFGWAELNARGIDKAASFYKQVFGWGTKESKDGGTEYTEFQAGDKSVAGGMEMNKMVPAEVPSYWLTYFNVSDLDKSFKKAIDAGAKELMAPADMGGERFAIVSDPQGATFGILQIKK